ncbi:MAG: LPS export ABC transporter periplasmic protein LptC [Solitalea-like symbiont of Acarus siro]
MKLFKSISFLYLLTILIVSCSNNELTINWPELENNYSVSKNIKSVHSVNSKINYVLEANIIQPYNKEVNTDELLQGFDLIIYDENNKPSSSIKANYGLYFHEKDIMEAKKGVIIKTAKNEIIKTDHLTWDHTSDKVYTDAFVTIITDKRTITGYGLESANNLQDFQLKKVSGTIDINN